MRLLFSECTAKCKACVHRFLMPPAQPIPCFLGVFLVMVANQTLLALLAKARKDTGDGSVLLTSAPVQLQVRQQTAKQLSDNFYFRASDGILEVQGCQSGLISRSVTASCSFGRMSFRLIDLLSRAQGTRLQSLAKCSNIELLHLALLARCCGNARLLAAS